jgi:hypothetical protein
VYSYYLRHDTNHSLLTASQSANEDKGLEPPPAKDEDPLGLELLNTSEPLQLAIRWLAPFDHLSVNDKHIWALTYDVSVRRGALRKRHA